MDGKSATENHEKHFRYKALTFVNDLKIVEKPPVNVNVNADETVRKFLDTGLPP